MSSRASFEERVLELLFQIRSSLKHLSFEVAQIRAGGGPDLPRARGLQEELELIEEEVAWEEEQPAEAALGAWEMMPSADLPPAVAINPARREANPKMPPRPPVSKPPLPAGPAGAPPSAPRPPEPDQSPEEENIKVKPRGRARTPLNE